MIYWWFFQGFEMFLLFIDNMKKDTHVKILLSQPVCDFATQSIQK